MNPQLLIANNEEDGIHEDLSDVYFLMGDEKKILCVVADWYEINVPQLFVLSEEKDYEMTDDEIFSFLSLFEENNRNYRLSDKTYKAGEDLSGLIFSIRYYLEHKDIEQEHEIVNHFDHYNTGERNRYYYETPEIDIEEALHLVQLILHAVYNYKGQYTFTKEEVELLE